MATGRVRRAAGTAAGRIVRRRGGCRRQSRGDRVEKQDPSSAAEELTTEQKRENVIRLAFGGRQEEFDRFVATVRDAIPPGAGVILRGSAVTGQRWKDGAPFDSDGPGTS